MGHDAPKRSSLGIWVPGERTSQVMTCVHGLTATMKALSSQRLPQLARNEGMAPYSNRYITPIRG